MTDHETQTAERGIAIVRAGIAKARRYGREDQAQRLLQTARTVYGVDLDLDAEGSAR